MLRKAVEESGRRREDNLRFVRGDAARLPFGDDSFDAVHTAGALHLMRGVDGVLQELARVVKPGGLVVIGTFVLGSNPLKRVVKRVTGRGVGFRWFDRDDLTQRLRRVGLDATEQALDGAALTLKAVRV
jgi:ubiquinone/menaquinone biosynthesis C-methylase UbiE